MVQVLPGDSGRFRMRPGERQGKSGIVGQTARIPLMTCIAMDTVVSEQRSRVEGGVRREKDGLGQVSCSTPHRNCQLQNLESPWRVRAFEIRQIS